MKNGCCCPFTGVHMIRFPLTILAGFAFIFAYDFVLHAKLLAGIYEQTSDLWRAKDDMKCTFMMIMQLLTSAVTALIFTRHYEGKGLCEGVRFGILLGLLMGILAASAYAWMPIPSSLALAWFFGNFGLGLGLGVVFSLIYRNPAGGKCG